MKQSATHLTFWEEGCSLEEFQRWCGDSEKAFKKEIRKKIREDGHKNILDCGAGVFSEYYGFKRDGYEIEYTAVEITPSFVELGKKQGINAVNASFSKMPFDDNQFDSTICLDVLNHQLDYKEEIMEMKRVTKNKIYISFFKPFSDDPAASSELSNFTSQTTDAGIVLSRREDEKGETTCIYNFFHRKRLTQFLEEIKLGYKKLKVEDNLILILNK